MDYLIHSLLKLFFNHNNKINLIEKQCNMSSTVTLQFRQK